MRPHSGVQAADLLRDAAKAVKGGGGGKGDVAVAGGKDPSGVDEALAHRRRGGARHGPLVTPATDRAVRVLGLDLGSKRIGVAVSDRSGTIASPLTVLARSGDGRHATTPHIAALVAEEEAERVVVGLPLSLDGSLGPAARAALAEAEALAAVRRRCRSSPSTSGSRR